MKHTPIHTEANKEDAGRVFFRTYIKDAHNNLIAECHDEDEAEHIVKCVNAHDGLVESLSNCMSLLWSLSLGSRPKPEDVSAAIKKADKAIEAAGMGGSDANI